MKIISRQVHGALDYIVGLVLIFAPNLFGFANGDAAQYVFVVCGIAALLYSVLTDYELGLFKVLPFRAHLAMDVLSGIVLALSPWLFGFADRVWIPHVVFGLIELGAVMMTRTAASLHSHPAAEHAVKT